MMVQVHVLVPIWTTIRLLRKELLKVKELHTQKYTLIRKISQLNITYYSYI
jgi:hypothetical protein